MTFQTNYGRKNFRKLTRAGKASLSLAIPRELAVELGWRAGPRAAVKKRGQGISVEGWKE